MCIHYQFFTSTYKDLAEYAELNPNQPVEAWERDYGPSAGVSSSSSIVSLL